MKKPAAKAGLSPNQRKAMASSSDPGPGGPHPASHSKAKSGRVDADIQDNTTAKAGSASQKRPVKLKNESGDVRRFFVPLTQISMTDFGCLE